SLEDFKCRGVAFGPEADVQLVLADAQVAHRQIRQPVRKRRIDIELIARRIRLKSQQCLGQHEDGGKALAEVATGAPPHTLLAWYRMLVAHKFDGSKARRDPGRPRIKREVEQLIVRMAKENHDWGYDRIVGALANLGYRVCDQTVGNVLQRQGLLPAPGRK